MAIQTRSSVLAVMAEVTEGTPVIPAGADDFIPLQSDFTMEPAFEQLENAELKSSIGMSKTIVGSENPTASFSAYIKHSGSEGDASQLDPILLSAFGDAVDAGGEYDTIAGSTTTVVKVDTGEGTNFSRGHLLLVKDPVNGYSIRPVHSVSGDDLTLGFPLQNAPGTGVNLGDAVFYRPVNTGHPTLTMWHYAGNPGAVQMMAGSRVTEASITFQAGQLINSTFNLEGLEYFFNPINITSSTRYLDFTDDGGTHAAVVATGFYKDPHELAEALQTAIAGVTTETITVVYSDTTGKFTIATSTSAVLSLLWNTGTNAANTIGTKIGFFVAANDTGATTYTSDVPQTLSAPYTPSYDVSDPLVAKSNLLLIGSGTETACFAANNVVVTLSTPRSIIDSICADSGRSGSLVNTREVTITVDAILNEYDADKFKRMRTNQETRFFYAFGEKSGNNWVAGKSGGVYVPTCVVSSMSLNDNDGIYDISLELKGFVDANGNGEIYLGFV